jgi:hypothetical protein
MSEVGLDTTISAFMLLVYLHVRPPDTGIGPFILTCQNTQTFTKRRINNQLDADKLRIIDVISSTCFGHHCAHHQEYRSEPTDCL